MVNTATRRHWFTLDPENGRIQGRPTNQISEGGNYIVRRRHRSTDATRFIRNLRGKATAGGNIEIVDGRKGDFVRFTADPVTQWPARSELAPRRMSDFGTTITVKMEFRVRAPDIDRLTGYILQFWQPVISPIAGVRVRDGNLEVVARTGGGAGTKQLGKGWNNLSVTFRPGDNGLLRVRGDIRGQVAGTLNGGSQASLSDEDIFRPKFGWYGSLSQSVAVDYRNLSIFASA